MWREHMNCNIVEYHSIFIAVVNSQLSTESNCLQFVKDRTSIHKFIQNMASSPHRIHGRYNATVLVAL